MQPHHGLHNLAIFQAEVLGNAGLKRQQFAIQVNRVNAVWRNQRLRPCYHGKRTQSLREEGSLDWDPFWFSSAGGGGGANATSGACGGGGGGSGSGGGGGGA